MVIVLTDGETQGINEARLARVWRRPPGVSVDLRAALVARRACVQPGLPEPQYRPDPAARSDLDRLATASGATVFDETELDDVTDRVRSALESGPVVTEGVRKTRLALAPYLLAFAILPLGVLLWRRDR